MNVSPVSMFQIKMLETYCLCNDLSSISLLYPKLVAIDGFLLFYMFQVFHCFRCYAIHSPFLDKCNLYNSSYLYKTTFFHYRFCNNWYVAIFNQRKYSVINIRQCNYSIRLIVNSYLKNIAGKSAISKSFISLFK